jgi:hypothetical protein
VHLALEHQDLRLAGKVVDLHVGFPVSFIRSMFSLSQDTLLWRSHSTASRFGAAVQYLTNILMAQSNVPQIS